MNAERLSVATNAVSGALHGVGSGMVIMDPQQVAAATAIARRTIEHLDEYDRRTRNETGRCPTCGAEDNGDT